MPVSVLLNPDKEYFGMNDKISRDTRIDALPTPFYVVYENRLRRNLDLISDVARRSGTKIIMAFKANALWRTFPIFREYGVECTASSLNELQLGVEELHCRVHSYCPAYTPATIGRYLEGSSHITFNSVSQWERFRADVEAFESQFGHLLKGLKWVNFGGGHLMTREGYDTAHLVNLIKRFRSRYPNLEVILEPGSAFTWRTGDLIASVVDVVENQGVRTAILDVSFACHMPDTLEMPYKPAVSEALPDGASDGFVYRFGGNSCLSGDFMGDWRFSQPLEAGQRLTFEDMNHYTTVKTNMFNGISHPDIVFVPSEGEPRYLRRFGYEDYKNRMS